MKKLIALALVGLMFCTGAIAEGINLDSMTFEQLIELREQITKEITNRAEWKNVYIPAGFYEIGVDIPAGHWTLTPALTDYFELSYGDIPNSTKTDISYDSSNHEYEIVAKRDSLYFDIASTDSYSMVMDEGSYLVIKGDCYISTYIRPTLDF